MTVAKLAHGLVVSAQTHHPGGPLDHPATLVRLALAAGHGGAAGFRVASPDVVALLSGSTDRPVIGITKRRVPGQEVFITPSVSDAVALVNAGADLVAAHAATRGRPAETFGEIVAACHALGVPVMADCATEAEAHDAVEAGADLIATTMAGYTRETRDVVPPALELAERLVRALTVPVVVEGGVWDPAVVTAAFATGAYAVVVGSAVTDPERITRRMVAAIPPIPENRSAVEQVDARGPWASTPNGECR
ncbi:N-acetylmannosamine-6-phosphate 2-epimerase [Xylanimonas ulmi]|uniref:N-acylglucosamine-6-phosphate 2-epimerase n=1 Tax=Xylanimonas ulmi TaxID=228973 RepID=A0A4Q7LXQ6_9MICO|nr:putative N-acetylmannosamine-6-phosphate 2-epimerase [Xylanibacterium ulmi]RZS59806.1 N-acylglucosamine-6-phosphate 2-epimerase [Xylanibacterium ulmi]